MGSLSKSLAHDAGKRPKPETPRVVVYNGERRSEKYVSGTADRFVDLQGNVVEVVLVPPGTPKTPAGVELRRQQLHNMRNADGTVRGFIEHGKCPLRHGLTAQIPALAAEFDEIFAVTPGLSKSACSSDPKTVSVDARGIRTYADGCPHVEALIAHRSSTEAMRRKSRSSRGDSVLDIERKKLAAAEEQNKQIVKLLERVVDSKPAKKGEIG